MYSDLVRPSEVLLSFMIGWTWCLEISRKNIIIVFIIVFYQTPTPRYKQRNHKILQQQQQIMTDKNKETRRKSEGEKSLPKQQEKQKKPTAQAKEHAQQQAHTEPLSPKTFGNDKSTSHRGERLQSHIITPGAKRLIKQLAKMREEKQNKTHKRGSHKPNKVKHSNILRKKSKVEHDEGQVQKSKKPFNAPKKVIIINKKHPINDVSVKDIRDTYDAYVKKYGTIKRDACTFLDKKYYKELQTTDDGYYYIYIKNHTKKRILFHQVCWSVYNNYTQIPDSFIIHQKCGNNTCISPDHLSAAHESTDVNEHRKCFYMTDSITPTTMIHCTHDPKCIPPQPLVGEKMPNIIQRFKK